ncbi:MAG: hypothetical protein GQE15_41475 [Archangiaceae bacterium]|nr:hypothetical protein [Archangiaceae bacterium]
MHARRFSWLFLMLALAGCPPVTVTSVQRSMLAPLPPPPMLNFDFQHAAQVSAVGQLRLLNVQPAQTNSGIGQPLGQVGFSPMLRISPRFSFGGQFQYISSSGVQFRNADSAASAVLSDALGLMLAGHFTAFEVGGFGIDGAVQLSMHGLPVSLGSGPGPLGSSPSKAFMGTVTLIPGVAVTLVPRFSGRYGTVFAGLGAHTNADIQARGLRVTQGTGVLADDTGSMREILGQTGIGYSYTAPFGLGVAAQVWLPIGAGRFGYGPTLTVALHGAFGAPPAKPVERAPPASRTTSPPEPAPFVIPPTPPTVPL